MTAPNPNLPRTPNYPPKQTTHLQIFPGAPNVIKFARVIPNSIKSEQLSMLLHLRTLLTWVYSIAADYPLNQAGRLLQNPENTQKSSAGLLSEQASRLITDLLLLLHTETGNQETRKQPQDSKNSRRILENWWPSTADWESEELQDLASFGGDCGEREVGKVDWDARQGTRTVLLIPRPRNSFLFRALAARARSPGLRTRIRYCTVVCVRIHTVYCMYVCMYTFMYGVLFVVFGVGFKLQLGMSVLFQQHRRPLPSIKP